MLKQMLPSMVSAAKYKPIPHKLVCYLQVHKLHVGCSAPHNRRAVTVKWPLQWNNLWQVSAWENLPPSSTACSCKIYISESFQKISCQLTQQMCNLWCLCNTFCIMILDTSSCELWCVISFFRLHTLDIIHTCSKCSREVGTLMCWTLHTKPQTKCTRTDEIFKLKTQIVPFWWQRIYTDLC